MNEFENEVAHVLVMNTVTPDCIRGSDAITFEDNTNEEVTLFSLVEVVEYVNAYLETGA